MILNVVLFVIFVLKRLSSKTKVRTRKIGNFIKAVNVFFKTTKCVENLENVETPEIGRVKGIVPPSLPDDEDNYYANTEGKNLHPIRFLAKFVLFLLHIFIYFPFTEWRKYIKS